MIAAPRWRKVLSDLLGNKVRTLLVILSIAVGVFAVGSVTGTFIILLGDMDADYQASKPHSGIIFCDLFDDDLVSAVEKLPEVGAAEGRSAISARVIAGPNKYIPIGITAIADFENIKVDLIRPPKDGSVLSLGDHEILIDESALSGMPLKAGEKIKIELGDGRVREIKLAGLAHDVNGPPYVFTNQFSGYVTPKTLEWLGGTKLYNSLYFTVKSDFTNEEHVRNVAKLVGDKVEKSGKQVYYTFVMSPGKHWGSDITKALGYLMGFMGVLSVLLSVFLVVNTINALVSQQIRQIGMMKAVGARRRQLVVMYLALVLCFGILAFLLAAPLAGVVGYGVSVFVSNFLNFHLSGFRIPTVVLVLEGVVALLIPLAATLAPVLNGTRVTIREAISDYGLGGAVFGKSVIDRMIERVRFLSRPLLLSLRNMFRRKTRLLLTLSTLTLGGSIFIAVFNLNAAFASEIDATLGYFLSDVNVAFNRPYRFQKIEPVVKSVPNVVAVEGWGFSPGQLLSRDEVTASGINIFAPAPGSKLIQPSMKTGRWLLPEDQNAMVVGNHLIKKRPDLQVGDEVKVTINSKKTTWKIVGIYQMAGNTDTPIVYVNNDYLAKLTNTYDQTLQIRIVTEPHDAATQNQVRKELEALFKAEGLDVGSIQTGAEIRQQNIATTSVLVYFLLFMAVLIAIVGGLGMTQTMGMNVMERTREIGVMRAIGARDRTILQLVLVEGMMVGVVSWIIGALFSIPISLVLNYAVGVSIVNSPMGFKFSFGGFIAWLIGMSIIAVLACIIPARNASRVTVREALAYE